MSKESVKSHANGSIHRASIGAQAAAERRQKHKLTPIEGGIKKMESHAMDRVKKLFYTAAYITLNELAHIQCQNSGTAASQLWCKSSLGSTYFNDKSCKVL